MTHRYVVRFYRDGRRVGRGVKIQSSSRPRAQALGTAAAIRMDGDAGFTPTQVRILEVLSR